MIGYAAKSREDIDATTEVAAIVVIASGVLAGSGDTGTASAIIAVTTLLLIEKQRLHALTRWLDEEALLASVHFAVLALVVLPLLPAGAYGPFGAIRPRELWIFVLFFSGLSFCAWIARRWHDPIFPRTFPHFGTESYWRDEASALEEVIQLTNSGDGGGAEGGADDPPPSGGKYFWDLN